MHRNDAAVTRTSGSCWLGSAFSVQRYLRKAIRSFVLCVPLVVTLLCGAAGISRAEVDFYIGEAVVVPINETQTFKVLPALTAYNTTIMMWPAFPNDQTFLSLFSELIEASANQEDEEGWAHTEAAYQIMHDTPSIRTPGMSMLWEFFMFFVPSSQVGEENAWMVLNGHAEEWCTQAVANYLVAYGCQYAYWEWDFDPTPVATPRYPRYQLIGQGEVVAVPGGFQYTAPVFSQEELPYLQIPDDDAPRDIVEYKTSGNSQPLFTFAIKIQYPGQPYNGTDVEPQEVQSGTWGCVFPQLMADPNHIVYTPTDSGGGMLLSVPNGLGGLASLDLYDYENGIDGYCAETSADTSLAGLSGLIMLDSGGRQPAMEPWNAYHVPTPSDMGAEPSEYWSQQPLYETKIGDPNPYTPPNWPMPRKDATGNPRLFTALAEGKWFEYTEGSCKGNLSLGIPLTIRDFQLDFNGDIQMFADGRRGYTAYGPVWYEEYKHLLYGNCYYWRCESYQGGWRWHLDHADRWERAGTEKRFNVGGLGLSAFAAAPTSKWRPDKVNGQRVPWPR